MIALPPALGDFARTTEYVHVHVAAGHHPHMPILHVVPIIAAAVGCFSVDAASPGRDVFIRYDSIILPL